MAPTPSLSPTPLAAPKASGKLIAFFVAYAVVILGILAFVLSIGPTATRLRCQRAVDRCELTHEFFFGYGRTPVWTFAQSSLTGAQLAKTLHGVGRATRPPMVLELMFRNGTTYPTIDFGYRSAAQAKVEELNRYLASRDASEIVLDSSSGIWRLLAIQYGIPVLLLLVVLLIRLLRRKKAPTA